MNSSNQNPPIDPAVADFFRAVGVAEREGKAAGAAALEAIPRLVRACYQSDSGQAVVIAAALASIYNGDCAPAVQLDQIRRLDWSLQKDLAAVILGVGHMGCPDTAIADAFRAIGGETALAELHWHTTGGPHRQALARLCRFIHQNAACSTAQHLRQLLASISHGEPANLSRLNFMDDGLSKDFVRVLDALFGRDQGCLHIEDIAKAFTTEGISLQPN